MLPYFESSYIYQKGSSYIIYDYYIKKYIIFYDNILVIETYNDTVAKKWMEKIKNSTY